MTDLSKLSDDEFKALYGRMKAAKEPAEPSPGITASGLGEAARAGITHEAVPAATGLLGDIHGMKEGAVDWLKGLVGGKPSEAPKPDTRSDYEKQMEGGGTPLIRGTPLDVAKTAILPTSESVKEHVSKVIPDYEPKNFAERAVKTSVGFLPGAALAPEAAGARLIPAAGRSVARYAAAPGLAVEGVKSVPIIKGTKYEDPVAMTAALLASHGTTRAITPLPATNAALADARTLSTAAGKVPVGEGATFTGGQLGGSSRARAFEAAGGRAENVNHENLQNFTGGALKHVGIDAKEAAPAIRTKLNSDIDNEFTRLTNSTKHGIPGGSGSKLEKDMNAAVKDYKDRTLIKVSDEPEKMAAELTAAFDKGGGFVSGRQYQDLRSRLGQLAVDAEDSSVGHAYREMRDVLDDKMKDIIKTYNSKEIGAFEAVRAKHQNKLILDRALRGQDEAAAHHLLTPQKLGAAAEHILGAERFAEQTHPLAKYARAGERTLKPLVEGGPGHDNFRLAAILAGGSLGPLGMAGAEHLTEGNSGHSNPAGYLLGAGAGAIPAWMMSQVLHSPVGKKYLKNQGLPRAAQIPHTQNPASAALMAEILSKDQAKK